MEAPGFWDDSERAGKVSAEHARMARRLETFGALERDVEDLEGLAELAQEDESLEGEVEEHIASAEARLAALEEQRLFSGPYDSGDALVSVNAGAGGTDAQDWAEMVLRMEMRWAESRGFQVELLEASAGRKRASSPPPSAPRGRTPMGCSVPSVGCTAWCASPRSILPTAVRPASRASRWPQWWRSRER